MIFWKAYTDSSGVQTSKTFDYEHTFLVCANLAMKYSSCVVFILNILL